MIYTGRRLLVRLWATVLYMAEILSRVCKFCLGRGIKMGVDMAILLVYIVSAVVSFVVAGMMMKRG